ncbi:related to integral membrane protein [Fusarium torulosum]|uniref:Related to integral membrane protein n=1 Tax=Fusarium torulosum TaxID=33205 RepID=A0AAE8M7C2_9HYPO|nr:related to integral membrane protein [Fusarium torulosum]
MDLPTSKENRSSTVIAVVVVCQVISVFIVALRLWTRGVIIRAVGADDYLAIVSLLCVLACGFSNISQTNYGLGRHVATLKEGELLLYLRNFYITIVLYTSAVMFLKMTLLVGYYRVLAVQNSRKFYIAAIVLVGGWSVSQLGVAIFGCSPIHGFWDLSVKTHCINTTVMWYTNVAGNIATDLIVIVLPIPAIVKLNLPNRQKWYLVGIFVLGTFTVIISFVRIPFLSNSLDVTWVQVKSTLWSILEITSALVCACLPTLRPFVRHYFPKLDSSLNNTGGGVILSDRKSGGNSAVRRPEVFRISSIPKAQGDLAQDDSSIIELCVVNSAESSTRGYTGSREHV